MEYKMLFSPMKIGNLTVKNRIVQTAMGVDINKPDGHISDESIAYYKERAASGVGLIITEYTRINESDGVSAVGQPSLADDSYIEGMKKLVDEVHASGAKIFVQLQHPGRQTVPIFPTFWKTFEFFGKVNPKFWDFFEKKVEKMSENGLQGGDGKQMKKMQRLLKPNLAPSRLPDDTPDLNLWYVKHKAMTKRQIKRIERQFIEAAVRAQKAGADGVELHATHGYLLQQFLSPFTNRRTDEYGGSFDNRLRVVKEILQGVKAACGKDFPVSVRLTVDEFEEMNGHPERGYHLEEGIKIARELEKYGADAINVSVGCTDTIFLYEESMRYPVGWRKYLAKAVKEAVSIPVIAVGVIRTPEQAERQLEEGDQDFIGLARALLADSEWVKKAADGREKEISRCIGCMRCMETSDANTLTTKPPECSLNPRLCVESQFDKLPEKDGENKTVLIIGAGVAGLSCAEQLALRGYDVTVWEKNHTEGGQLLLAAKPPYKSRILWASEDYKNRALAAGAKIVFDKNAPAEEIIAFKADHTILATGGYASHPKIPGADQPYVFTADEVLGGKAEIKNKRVAVIGSGMTGLETAEFLADKGNRITVVEAAEKIAPNASSISTQEIIPELKKKDVVFLPGHKLERIADNKIYLKDGKGNVTDRQADFVVLSLGVKPNNTLYEELKDKIFNLYVIGDASKPGRIVNAVHEGFLTGRILDCSV